MDSVHGRNGARVGSVFSQDQASSWVLPLSLLCRSHRRLSFAGHLLKAIHLCKPLALILLSSSMYLYLVGSLQPELSFMFFVGLCMWLILHG